jgi:hypothetical protein
MTDTNGKKLPRVDNSDFVKTWMGSDNLDEVLVNFPGRSKSWAMNKACQLRKKGVHLKRFSRTKKNLDVAKLNQLVHSYG